MHDESNTLRKRWRNARGFTLIELMATLVILAIILAIAVPAIGNLTAKAKEQARLASIELIENAGELAHIDDLPFDTEKPASVTETDVYLIPTLVKEGYLKLDEDSEFYDNEQWVRKMNKSGMFKYMGRGDGTTDPGNGGGETPEPETPVEPEVPAEPEFVTYCPAEGETSIYKTTNLVDNNIRINGFADGYTPPSTDIILPTMICDRTVTTVGSSSAVFSPVQLTSVVLPEKVRSIGVGTFANNRLTSIDMPDTVTSIGSSAFENNALTSVDLPPALTTLNGSAFQKNQIASVTFPSTLSTIGSAAFRDNRIRTLSLPSTLSTIGDNAFSHNGMTSLTLANGLTAISRGAFMVNELTSVSIPASVTLIDRDAFLTNKIASLDIPATVASVRSQAFADNAFTSVTLRNPNLDLAGSTLSSTFNNHLLDATPASMTIRVPNGSALHTYANNPTYRSGYTIAPF